MLFSRRSHHLKETQVPVVFSSFRNTTFPVFLFRIITSLSREKTIMSNSGPTYGMSAAVARKVRKKNYCFHFSLPTLSFYLRLQHCIEVRNPEIEKLDRNWQEATHAGSI